MEYLTLSENILDSLMEEFPAIRTLIEHTGDYNDAVNVINDTLALQNRNPRCSPHK